MRQFSPALTAALAAAEQPRALCVRLATATTPLLLATWDQDIVLTTEYGAETYIATGRLLGVQDVSEDASLTAQSVEFTLSGIPTADLNRALLEAEDVESRRVDLYQVWLSPPATPVGHFRAYSGFADIYRHDEAAPGDDGEPGKSTLTLRTENRLLAFQKPSARTWTTADQQLIDATDTGFDSVPLIQETDPGRWILR